MVHASLIGGEKAKKASGMSRLMSDKPAFSFSRNDKFFHVALVGEPLLLNILTSRISMTKNS